VRSSAPRIRLRPWRDADIPALRELRNDVELQSRLLARARGSDDAGVRDWLVRRNSGTSLLLVVADSHDDRAIGYVQAMDIDRDDRRADVGICLAPAYQGAGLGTEAMRCFLSHLALGEGIGKVTLRVRLDNDRAIACYRRIGFRECGTLRAHACFDGRFIDVVLMEVFLDPTRVPPGSATAHG
jgi:RimJ/RimL family protein N-acetyltransferase